MLLHLDNICPIQGRDAAHPSSGIEGLRYGNKRKNGFWQKDQYQCRFPGDPEPDPENAPDLASLGLRRFDSRGVPINRMP